MKTIHDLVPGDVIQLDRTRVIVPKNFDKTFATVVPGVTLVSQTAIEIAWMLGQGATVNGAKP